MGTVTNRSNSHRAVNVRVDGVGRCIQLTPGVTKTLDAATFVALRDHEYTRAIIAAGIDLVFVDDSDPFVDEVVVEELVEVKTEAAPLDDTVVEKPKRRRRKKKETAE